MDTYGTHMRGIIFGYKNAKKLAQDLKNDTLYEGEEKLDAVIRILGKLIEEAEKDEKSKSEEQD